MQEILGGELGETARLCWKDGLSLPLESISFNTEVILSYRQLRLRYQNSSLHPPLSPKSRIHRSRSRGVTPRLLGRTMKIGHQRQFRALVYAEAAFEAHIQQSPLSRLSSAAILFFSRVSKTALSCMETQHEPGSTAAFLRITHPGLV